jgi:PAS domain S-box-containing protein
MVVMLITLLFMGLFTIIDVLMIASQHHQDLYSAFIAPPAQGLIRRVFVLAIILLAGAANAYLVNRMQKSRTIIRQKESRLRALVNNVFAGIGQAGSDGRFIFVNSRLEEMFRAPAGGLLGRHYVDLLAPGQRDESTANIRRLMTGNIPHIVVDRRYQRLDGSVFWGRLAVVGVHDEGKVTGILGIIHDITEYKQAEQALRDNVEELNQLNEELSASHEELEASYRQLSASEEMLADSQARLQTLFDNALVGAIAGTQERVTECNQRMAHMLGYEVEDVLELTFAELSHPDDIAIDRRQLIQLFKGEISGYHVEKRLRRSDGSYFPAEVAVSAIRDDAGRVQSILAIVSDLTARHEAEEALKASERQFRQLFEAAPLSMELHDRNGVLVDTNPAWEEIWQLPAKDVIGKYNLLSDPQLQEKGLTEYFERVYQGETINLPGETYYDPRLSGFNGQPRWLRTICYPLHDRDGEVWQIAVVHVDVTTEKEALEALRESEARAQLAFEQVAIGMAMLDTHGRYVRVNPAYCQLLGYTEQQLLQLSFQSVADPSGLADTVKIFNRLRKGTEQAAVLERACLAHDGSVVWIRAHYSVVCDEKGKVLFVVEQAEDISARREAEERQLATERRFQQLFRSMPDGVCLCEMVYGNQGNPVDYLLQECNPAFERLTGIRLEPEEDQTAADVFAAAPPHLAICAGVASSGTPITFENSLPGVDRTFRIVVAPLEAGRFALVLEDITEQLKVQQLIEEHSALLNSIFESALLGIALVNRDGRYYKANRRWASMLGYTMEELLRLGPEDVSIPEDAVISKHKLKQLFRGDVDSYVLEKQYQRKDGSSFWGRTAVSAIRDASGELVSALGLMADISERRQAEEALRESEEKFRVVAEQALMGIAILKDGRIMYANQAHADMTGYSVEEMLSWEADAWMHRLYPEQVEELVQVIARRLEGNISAAAPTVWRLRTSDGRTRLLNSMARPINYLGGPALLTVSLDVTDQHQAERRIRLSEQRLSLALDASKQGMWDLDLFNKTAVVNYRFLEILGLKPTDEPFKYEELLNRIHSEDQQRVEAVFEEHLEGRRSFYEAEYRLQHTGGYYIWLLDRGRIVERNHRGIPVRAVGTITDITQRKQMEEELRRSQIAAAELSGIHATTATLAHEINNPLTGIMGSLQMLEGQENMTAPQQQMLDEMRSAAQKMRDAVNQLQQLERARFKPYLERGRIIDLRNKQQRADNGEQDE